MSIYRTIYRKHVPRTLPEISPDESQTGINVRAQAGHGCGGQESHGRDCRIRLGQGRALSAQLAGEPKNDNADEDLYTYWVDRLQKAAALVMPYPSATYRALAMVDEGAAGAPRRINPNPQGRLVELMLGAI